MPAKYARALMRPLLALMLLLGAVVAIPTTAEANGCDRGTALQNYAPDTGTIYAHKLSGGRYSASISFVLTSQQIANLQCLGGYLEIDFRLHGSGIPGYWQDYAAFSNGLERRTRHLSSPQTVDLRGRPDVSQPNPQLAAFG